jgi:hypothetical protein
VTVPVPAPVFEIVILPVVPLRVIPDPACRDVTPAFDRVTTPEVPPPERPGPATISEILPEVPLLAAVILPKRSTVRLVFV